MNESHQHERFGCCMQIGTWTNSLCNSTLDRVKSLRRHAMHQNLYLQRSNLSAKHRKEDWQGLCRNQLKMGWLV
jgi:hypothetical protein